MAEIIIASYFEDGTGPATGLSPTVRIWEVTASGQSLVVGAPCGSGQATDGVMTEMSDCGSPLAKDGFYRFTFTDLIGYDPTKVYAIRIDGGASLGIPFRYQTNSISPSDALDAAAVEGAVWDAPIAAHTTAATMGYLENLIDLIRKYSTNRTKIDVNNKTLTIYDDDCATVLRVFRLLDHTGTPSITEVCERTSIGGTLSGSSPTGSVGPDGQPTCSTAAP